ncbi:hypothetical protein FRC07_002992 [Ceratobasidium sp. 392]|nr:hypothetical protein FRC07_002992 [Ceratobasidium sp. 392]
MPREIKKLCPDKTDEDWRIMFEEERKYLESLKAPSDKSAFAMLYVQRLRILNEKQRAFREVFGIEIELTTPADMDPARQSSKGQHSYHKSATNTRRLEARRTAAYEQLAAAQVEVATLESEHSISPRWSPGCAEWVAAEKREAQNRYYDALRDLELLVVQRIAELEKSHLMGTGYKLRKKINQAIIQREKAVHRALERYNEAARTLDPPRRTFAFKDLVDCAHMADFDFLKYSEHGAQDADWARPAHRRCVAAWHKVQRAKEEIIRLNVEIRRVYTQIRDEERFLSSHYENLLSSDPDLAHSLFQRLQLTFEVDRHILRDLESITKLKGFSGDLSCGKRVGLASVLAHEPSMLDGILEGLSITDEAVTNLNNEVAGEPSDEASHAAAGIEECCQVM